MTIFEAKPLKTAVKSRAKQYEDLKGQVETLKKEFQGMVDLDDELSGAGATAIKNFYRAQVTVANAWIELFDTQITFLKGIPAILEDADLSGETVVEVPFLEGEVAHGLTNAKSMVNQQSTDLQKIFQNIEDILPLSVFKQDDFHEKMENAETEKNNTIKKVQEVDNKLVEEYQVTEAQESVAVGLLQALLEATAQDVTVSPMNFNQSAFQASEAYQVKDEVAESMQGYRDFKQQEEEARKLEKEMEELENRPWYEKAWDTTKTFTGEITGYYDSVRATTGVDPVTGRELSEAERIAAGAMAAAGFIPIVGWAGRAVKGGSAIYKTAKGFNAAENALDAYKSSKGLDILQKTEYGLYGLTAANGLGEAATGKDMFGNELTDEQRQNSLMTALGITVVGGAAKYVDNQKFMPKNEGANVGTGKSIEHPVLDNTRSGSALKGPDGQHGFNDIIDNYTPYAKEFEIVGGDGLKRGLYQIEGGMKYYDYKDVYNKDLRINERVTTVKDQDGIFEWIVDPNKGVTHRRFIPNGQITGSPNQRP